MELQKTCFKSPAHQEKSDIPLVFQSVVWKDKELDLPGMSLVTEVARKAMLHKSVGLKTQFSPNVERRNT